MTNTFLQRFPLKAMISEDEVPLHTSSTLVEPTRDHIFSYAFYCMV